MAANETRDTRIAENEAAFRAANESLRVVFENDEGADRYPFLCECGDPRCTVVVMLGLDAYAGLREHPSRFVIAPGHKQLDTETILEEGEGFQLIEKTGVAGDIARAHWQIPANEMRPA
ncbi:MAG: hypothetical protein JO017_09530 [Actinobacteria bacterium]|nr:hypothetical protein [Actinomycetota bacterium]